MKPLLKVIIFSTILIGGPVGVKAQVLTGAHDPTVIKDDRCVYSLLTTNNLLQIRQSTDEINWKVAGNIFTAVPAWVNTALGTTIPDIWAPCVRFNNGLYWVYYACSSFGTNSSVIGVASNPTLDPTSASYKWTDRGLVIQSGSANNYNCIDPDLFVDSNNNAWLLFGSFWSGIKMIAIDPNTGKQLASNTTIYSLASRGGGAIEGAALAQHGGYYYLFSSWDTCCQGVSSTYNTRVGRATNITGPYVDEAGTALMSSGGTELLSSYAQYIGPGGGDVFQDGRRTYFAHHYYDANHAGNPELQIREVVFDNQGWCDITQPYLGRRESFEAEHAHLVDAPISMTATASNGDYVTGITAADSQAAFYLNVPEAGNYEVGIRYANTATTAASQMLTVNSNPAISVAYPSTGTTLKFAATQAVTVSVSLSAGYNLLSFKAGTGSVSLDRLDLIRSAGDFTQAGSDDHDCSVSIQSSDDSAVFSPGGDAQYENLDFKTGGYTSLSVYFSGSFSGPLTFTQDSLGGALIVAANVSVSGPQTVTLALPAAFKTTTGVHDLFVQFNGTSTGTLGGFQFSLPASTPTATPTRTITATMTATRTQTMTPTPTLSTSGCYNLVVAQDGSGNYTTVQAALNAVPNNSASRTVIYVKNGTYQEPITLASNKINVSLIGQSPTGVVLTENRDAAGINPSSGVSWGTGGSASTYINAAGFFAANITFQNASTTAHDPALAISIGGDKAVFLNCLFLGPDDTIYGDRCRQYFQNCYIAGNTDFIFGPSTTVFQNCELHSHGGTALTAASTENYVTYGYVFLNCKVTTDPGVMIDLGRPWRPYADVAYLNCNLGSVINPPGWDDWNDTTNDATARFAEYQNTSTNTVARVPYDTILTTAQAAAYNTLNVLSTTYAATPAVDNWNPLTVISSVSASCIPTSTITPISITATFTKTKTPTATMTLSPTKTPTLTPTKTPTATLTATLTVSKTPTASFTATPSASPTKTQTLTPTVTATASVTKTVTLAPTQTSTTTSSPTGTASYTKTASPTLSPSPTITMTSTVTSTLTATKTASPSTTLTLSPSPTRTMTPTQTTTTVPSATNTSTPSVTKTSTVTLTPTATLSATDTKTSTPSPTITLTKTLTLTPSQTLTATPTQTPTVTLTQTQTRTPLPTATWTSSPTVTQTPTVTLSPSPTGTMTRTLTLTPTATVFLSPTATGTFTQGPPISTPIPFPNPASGPTVTVTFTLRDNSPWVHVEVFTTAFRKVNEVDLFNQTAGAKQVTLPLTDSHGSPLANGIYYILVVNEQGRAIGKLLVLK